MRSRLLAVRAGAAGLGRHATRVGFDVEDVAVATIEHASGVVGSITSVFNGVRDREERRLEVFFETAALEATTDFVIGAPEDSLLVKRDRVPVEHVDVTALRRATFAADGLDPDREYFVYQYLAYRAFAVALRSQATPSPTIDDAVHAHEVVEAGYRSAERGAPVTIAEPDRLRRGRGAGHGSRGRGRGRVPADDVALHRQVPPPMVSAGENKNP